MTITYEKRNPDLPKSQGGGPLTCCSECGSIVAEKDQGKHTSWHSARS